MGFVNRSHKFDAEKLKEKFDDFDGYMDTFSSKPTSKLRARGVHFDGDDDGSSSDSSDDESPRARRSSLSPKRGQLSATHSGDLERMLAGGTASVMSSRTRKAAQEAKRKSNRRNQRQPCSAYRT